MVIEINTPRLLLRQWRDEDYLSFARLNADPFVMAHFPSVLDEQASIKMANRCRQLIEQKGWGFWAVELKGQAEFIGFVGLHEPSMDLPFSPCVEIGWRLAKEFWGQGIATEAAKEVLAFGFRNLLLNEIVSFTALLNKRSEAVMKRLNMSYKSIFEHPALPKDSPLLKHCLYGLAKERWLNLK